MAILHPTSAEFENLLKSEKLILADFFATWCGPCKMIAPTIETLAEDYDSKACIVKIDIDQEMSLAEKYGVMSVPTVMIFKDGQPFTTEVGARPLAVYSQHLESALRG